MMSWSSFEGLVIVLLVSLVMFSTFDVSDAREGSHWREERNQSSSLAQERKSSGHHLKHTSKPSHPKPKPPSPSPSPSPTPTPKPSPPPTPQSKVFNVRDFGARGDGATDDTKAFLAAWAAACKVQDSTVMVPSGFTFLVGPISFSGPTCQPNILFQLDGTITAPTSPKAWGSGTLQWLEFTKLKGITVSGSGVIEGQGSVWWSRSSLPDDHVSLSAKLSGNMPQTKPTVLRFYGSYNVIVSGIRIQNSPQCHLKFDTCQAVQVFDVTLSSPEHSPNTDGIHLQNSMDVVIHHSNLGCGDDCISIQTGSSAVNVHDVNCGPGHGISIGGLGKGNTEAHVSNITVQNVKMTNTMTGIRIKTWQGASGSVQEVKYSNVQVSGVQIPIVIDQYYCDGGRCKNQTSAVAISDVTYEQISGTYTVQPVYFACSDNTPCVDINLSNIKLEPLQETYQTSDPFCWRAYGSLQSPTIPAINCLQKKGP